MEMDMKMTKANIEKYAKSKGYAPLQIDSIPEGFCFKKPSITIGGVLHDGEYVAFIPLADWENENVIHSPTIEGLVKLYKVAFKKNGK